MFSAFHATEPVRAECAPYVLDSGAILTWEGRLDNPSEIAEQVGAREASRWDDLPLVASAFERWGTEAFGRLIGDWSISVWLPKERTLILATDPIGTRPLHYLIDPRGITWSNTLEPLLLLTGRSFSICEEYLAGWLARFPAAHLTPFREIHSVPPSSYVSLRAGMHRTAKYWEFDPADTVRYSNDAEYEEHFRSLFRRAVRRRLRSCRPVLAELSGGMDSSAIVCMADSIIASGEAGTPRLDTVSYYDDSDPNWNERPYFTKIEERRARIGLHIDASRFTLSGRSASEVGRIIATPAGRADLHRQLRQYLIENDIRVILSGVGGDEVTGGVPTPLPELADLMARGRLRQLAKQLKIWAVQQRIPWFQLLAHALSLFLPAYVRSGGQDLQPVPWLDGGFARRNRRALRGYEKRLRFLGPRPSFQETLVAVEGLRRQMACTSLWPEPVCERRYPYLDRNLLEFLFAIPREQLVRPGQRRSLMRRALVGIVPSEILQRRRKAHAGVSGRRALSAEWMRWGNSQEEMISATMGIIDGTRFTGAMRSLCEGRSESLVPMLRTLGLERWLRALSDRSARGSQYLVESPGWPRASGEPFFFRSE